MSDDRDYPMPVFELTCLDCRTPTQVVVDFGGPPRGTEIAVTCDSCQRTHWVTFAMGEVDPQTGAQNVVVDFSDSRNETTADALKDYLDLIDEVVEQDVTDEVIENGLRELLQPAGSCGRHTTDPTDGPMKPKIEDLVAGIARPTGNSRHILTLGNEWSTAIDQLHDSSYAIENPAVIDELLRIIEAGEEGSVVLRTFTPEIGHTLANGTDIPVKEVRGWRVADGRLHPITGQQMFSASCTDAATGEPIAPERAVQYTDAHPIEAVW